MNGELPLLPTLMLDSRFTQEELDFIDSEAKKHCVGTVPSIHEADGPLKGCTVSYRYFWDYEAQPQIKDLIHSKLPKEIADIISIPRPGILESYIPYEIHCDYGWFDKFNLLEDDEVPYCVIIIPLRTVDSSTIVLNQQGKYLHFVDYKNDHSPLPLDQRLSEEEFSKYFSHCWPQEREYVSIESIFEWNAGSILICDIRYFHLSNNFLNNGVDKKECITLFAKIKQKDFARSYNSLIESRT